MHINYMRKLAKSYGVCVNGCGYQFSAVQCSIIRVAGRAFNFAIYFLI
jgi:hypothetical protein